MLYTFFLKLLLRLLKRAVAKQQDDLTQRVGKLLLMPIEELTTLTTTPMTENELTAKLQEVLQQKIPTFLLTAQKLSVDLQARLSAQSEILNHSSENPKI